MRFPILLLIALNMIMLSAGLIGLSHKKQSSLPEPTITTPIVEEEAPKEKETPKPINYTLKDPRPSYLDYSDTAAKLAEWEQEAPELAEVGIYGKSTRGASLSYIRVTNERLQEEKKRVLITACIHGNEPLCASTLMQVIGNLMDKYGDDEQVTKLLDTREIYFVPVVSPDSYPHSREVDGVDPNRDFPHPKSPNHRSVAPVAALQEFFMKIRPQAVISGHTSGRFFLIPWGDQMQNCPDHDSYVRIVSEMSKQTGYRWLRACDLYGGAFPRMQVSYRPVYGGELDWYYRNGAMTIVIEFGLHQQIPSERDVFEEANKTNAAILYFIEEAPKIEKTAELRTAA